MINIGENIRKVREKERSYTQKYMATCLGLTTKAYSNIENGVTDVTFRRLHKIAEILECDLFQIINYNKLYFGMNDERSHTEDYPENTAVVQGSDRNTMEKIEGLYIQLLESEKDKVRLLEKMLDMKYAL